MSDRHRPVTLLLVFCLSLAASVNAQDPPPFKLSFEADPALGPGKIAVAEGVTATKLARFAIEGLDVAQPVSVVVSTGDPAKPVEVRIAKDNFDAPEQKAMTGSDGTVIFQLRTQGDFGIGVGAPGGEQRAFQLAVWAGDIMPPENVPFLAPVSNYDAATLAKLKASAAPASVEAGAAAAPATGVGMFGWLGLAVGAVAAIGLLLVGVGLLRRKPGGQ